MNFHYDHTKFKQEVYEMLDGELYDEIELKAEQLYILIDAFQQRECEDYDDEIDIKNIEHLQDTIYMANPKKFYKWLVEIMGGNRILNSTLKMMYRNVDKLT